MNRIKDFLMPLAIAILVTLFVQNLFFRNKKTETENNSVNKSFVAPSSKQVIEPLDLDVDFYIQKDYKVQEEITKIITSYGELDFSNYGAVIKRLAYFKLIYNKESLLETLSPDNIKDNGAFLVALNGLGHTPYYYKLVENSKSDNFYILVYKSQSDFAKVTKKFIINDDVPEIKLICDLEPINNEQVRSRIFLPGPLINESTGVDFNNAVFCNEHSKIEKKKITEIQYFGKERPTIFGLEDHYFINTLIKDVNNFVSRAYFKLEGPSKAISIFETEYIRNFARYELDFYCGPKDINYFAKVDKKLNETLDYGWLWFIALPLIYMLNFIYSIFKSYGLAIIILTFLIKLVLVPFTIKGEQAKRKNIDVQKKLKYIEQAYKDNPELLAQERMEIIRKHGLPGFSGFLPMFIQIPIFIGLSKVLNNSFELYKIPFLWIPDLSSIDPYYILPILVGISIIIQSLQNAADARQNLSIILVSIIVTAIMSNIAAGLVLYILVSNILSIGQTYIQRRLKI